MNYLVTTVKQIGKLEVMCIINASQDPQKGPGSLIG